MMRCCVVFSFVLQLALPTIVLAEAVDFDTEIVPIFSKAGCNAAACHGGAAGRGGFRLSLFGGDPEFDLRSVARELEGRRVNPVKPHLSLLVRKPTEDLPHGGGAVLEPDGAAVQTLKQWIAEGAHRLESRRLESLSVEPRQVALDRTPAEFTVRVVATFDDGTRRDVTELATFASLDESAATFDPHGGVVVTRPGRQTIMVRYAGHVAPVGVTTPLGTFTGEYPEEARQNWIDDAILDTLRELRLPVSPQADDATFLRRVSLDLTGRLPSVEQTQSFLADRDPHKRSALIDRLLASDEFTEFWTYRFARILRVRSPGADRAASEAFHRWLADRIRENAAWDEMARTLVLARGDSHTFGPATMHRLHETARDEAEYVSEVFLGVRLRCANCHNHPLDRWTQDDYHGLAQVFAPIERGRIVKHVGHGEVIHPRTGVAATPRIPGGQELESDRALEQFADWLVSDDNPYFARSIVARIWRNLMGRGLVEPADDLRATNPSSHPELHDRLAAEFVESGYDLRGLIRLITNSAAYGRSSVATGENAMDTGFYAHAIARPLTAEVLADAIDQVLGVPCENANGRRAIAQVDAQPSAALGVCDRSTACDTGPPPEPGVAAKLSLLNGPLLNERIADEQGVLKTLLRKDASVDTIVEQFYYRALCRPPTAADRQTWELALADVDDEEQRGERCEDFVWSLLNCREFVMNQ